MLGRGGVTGVLPVCGSCVSREADSNEIAGIRATVKITSFPAHTAPTSEEVSGKAPAEHGSALHQTQKPDINAEARLLAGLLLLLSCVSVGSAHFVVTQHHARLQYGTGIKVVGRQQGLDRDAVAAGDGPG